MLSRKLRLRKKQDFDSVYRKGKSYSCKYLKLYILNTDLPSQRFGFSISKKVSKKAFERNKLKRQLSFVLREELNNLKTGSDIIFVVRNIILDLSYSDIKYNVRELLKKANLYTGN
ncbi:MAG: ribonuclease P protein component [Candidatus Sericytochromatia bacterium]